MTWSPASGRRELETRLRQVGGQADDQIDLAGVALVLAALDRPRVPLQRYSDHLAQLRRDTAALAAELRAEASLEDRLDILKKVVVERHAYKGDTPTYDDLQNANLMRVIDRRKGLPVALGILYITAARPLGWSIGGLNFPGHFLLRLEMSSTGLVFDPFNDARRLDTGDLRRLLKSFVGDSAELMPDHYRPVENREILLRLQNNIKLRLLQAERTAEALEVLESMLMFAPGEARLWREAGLIHAHLGNLRAAAMALEHFLELGQDSNSLHEAAALLQQVKARLNCRAAAKRRETAIVIYSNMEQDTGTSGSGMSLAVAIQMDPIESIDINADSTFVLALEAQRRGHGLYHYLTQHLSFREGRVCALARPLEVRREAGNHATLGAPEAIDLTALDVVLMRQDPPFDMAYITATHLLEHVHPGTLVVNDPIHVRNAPEKLFVTHFGPLMPPTLISSDRAEILDFRKEHKDIIVKPLFGNGGAGVFHIGPEDENLGALLEMFTDLYREPIIVQRYLPEVRAGDKRIILIDGRAVGAINRVPPPGEARANMHVGARPEKSELDHRDLEICEAIGPVLEERGLIFVGIDVIGGYMTEINVTSPTGLQEINRFDGVSLESDIWDAIEIRFAARHGEHLPG